MTDHATVFYCEGFGYLLCYDSDIEHLPAPTRLRMPTKRLHPFKPIVYNAGMLNRTYVIRIVYRPADTLFGRRIDQMIDRYAVVELTWIKRMAMQFAAVFPAGLDEEHILKAQTVEVLE